jgi:hypothetical protein
MQRIRPRPPRRRRGTSGWRTSACRRWRDFDDYRVGWPPRIIPEGRGPSRRRRRKLSRAWPGLGYSGCAIRQRRLAPLTEIDDKYLPSAVRADSWAVTILKANSGGPDAFATTSTARSCNARRPARRSPPAIKDKYRDLGWEAGFLGFLDRQTATPDGWAAQPFRARLDLLAPRPAPTKSTARSATSGSSGLGAGFRGLPEDEPTQTASGASTTSRVARSTALRLAPTKCMDRSDRWGELGWEQGCGVPVSDERRAHGHARVSDFQASPSTGMSIAASRVSRRLPPCYDHRLPAAGTSGVQFGNVGPHGGAAGEQGAVLHVSQPGRGSGSRSHSATPW